MALALDHWMVSVTLEDQGGDKSILRFELPSSVVYADANTAAAALVASLDGVTDAGVLAYSLAQVNIDTAASGGGEVAEQALLVVKTDADKSAVMRIPAPVDGIFVGASGPTYNDVDVTDAALLAYLAHFDTGLFEISDGEKFDTLVSGKRVHRATKKG